MILIIISIVLLVLVSFTINTVSIAIMSVGMGVVELGFMLMIMNCTISAVVTLAIKDMIDSDYDEIEDEE